MAEESRHTLRRNSQWWLYVIDVDEDFKIGSDRDLVICNFEFEGRFIVGLA